MSFDSKLRLFSGTSHPWLARLIAVELGVEISQSKIEAFPDGEIGVQILENVRGRDVFVVQSCAHNPNHYLMELLIFVDALKRASAGSITAVLPYFPYSRQDRKGRERAPVTAKLVANLLEKAGVNRVLTMDLHADQVEGFFDIPVDNLKARALLASRIDRSLDWAIVAPDLGSIKLAKEIALTLDCEMAIIDKRRIRSDSVSSEAMIGEVKGKDVLIVDDLVSSGKTTIEACKLVKELGAKSVSCAVTHFLAEPKRFSPCSMNRFYITDTVTPADSGFSSGFEIVSVAPLFAEAIRSIQDAGSILSLL